MGWFTRVMGKFSRLCLSPLPLQRTIPHRVGGHMKRGILARFKLRPISPSMGNRVGLAYVYRIGNICVHRRYGGQSASSMQGEVDLFIAEAYTYEPRGLLHLDVATLLEYHPLINPKRTILTHMGMDVLNRVSFCPCPRRKMGWKSYSERAVRQVV